MRGIFGVLGLLIVVAVIGVVAKKQLTSLSSPPVTSGSGPGGATQQAPATPREQVQQFQKAAESAVQAPRPMPDEK